MTGKTVTASKRDVWEAFDAMAGLVSQSWEASIGLRLGRTFRRLRTVREDIDGDRTVLLNEYAVKGDDHAYVKDVDGTIRLSDPAEFNAKWRDLLSEETTLEVFPVALAALTVKGKKGRCKECNRLLGPIAAAHLEVLDHLGIIEVPEEPADDEGDQ